MTDVRTNPESSPLVLCSIENSIATLTLNRPKQMNALNRPLLEALNIELDRLGARRDIRAVLLTGAGERAFCAGADLKERAGMSPEETRSFLRLIQGTMNVIEEMPQPTFACIEGYAFGGGTELALACDFRIASKSTTMGLTETRLGIIPGAGGTQRLPRLVGLSVAKRLIFAGKRLSGQGALDIHLVDACVEDSTTLDEATRWAEEFLESAPIAVEAAKKAIQGGIGCGLHEGLTLERCAYEVTLYTEDRIEALTAFKEKRAPQFKGV